MSRPEDKRQYPRAPISWPITIRTAKGEVHRTTANLSAVGAFVPNRRPAGLGRTFSVCLHIPHLSRPMEAKARVAWSRVFGRDQEVGATGTGINFVEMATDDRKLLNHLVTHFLKLQKLSGKPLPPSQRLDLDTHEES